MKTKPGLYIIRRIEQDKCVLMLFMKGHSRNKKWEGWDAKVMTGNKKGEIYYTEVYLGSENMPSETMYDDMTLAVLALEGNR